MIGGPVQSLAFIASIALGVTFLVSGLGKLRDPTGFIFAVLDYQILSPGRAVVYGRLLPWLELMCGLALISGALPRLAGAVAAATLLSFLVAVEVNLMRGRRLDCYCFGGRSEERLGWVTVVRLCTLLACATVAVGWRGGSTFAPWPADPVPSLSLAAALVLALYFLRAVPLEWRNWHLATYPGIKPTGGRTSLRHQPLRSESTTPDADGNT
jgi:hypothetical protein